MAVVTITITDNPRDPANPTVLTISRPRIHETMGLPDRPDNMDGMSDAEIAAHIAKLTPAQRIGYTMIAVLAGDQPIHTLSQHN